MVANTGELLDKRRTYTFYVDDALIDHFAPAIGVYGVAVYVLLVRHAKNHKAFPSWTRIATRLGISRKTVQRTLADLQQVGLITIAKRRSPHGDADTNIYTIQDLSYLRKPLVSQPLDVGTVGNQVGTVGNHLGTPGNQGGDSRKPRVGTVGNHGGDSRELEGILFKESHLKESHLRKKDISAVLETSSTCGPALPPVGTVAQLPKKPKSPKTLAPWPDEDRELETWLQTQGILTGISPPLEYAWWCKVSYVISGMPTPEWLEPEFAKMQLWLDDNPRKKPTPRGVSAFLRHWLERAYNDARRVRQNPAPKEIHIHYGTTGRR